MSTIHFRNAKVLVDGAHLSASFNELNVEHAAEMLDETAFGDDTRTRKGGLYNSMITGRGHCEFESNGVEDTLFTRVGTDGSVIVVFPNGITEGTATEKGFGMQGVLSVFNIGDAVGTILPFDMTAEFSGPPES